MSFGMCIIFGISMSLGIILYNIIYYIIIYLLCYNYIIINIINIII